MQNRNVSPTVERARGRWYEILSHFGIPDWALRNRAGPCPLCGGKDRYRWDDKGGSGTYFCNGCGPGNGFSLLMKFKDWDFKTAAREVDEFLSGGIVGISNNVAKEEKDPRIALRKVFNSAKKVKDGGEVQQYLKSRGLSVSADDLDCILEHPKLFYSPGVLYPAMLALVKSHDGRDVAIHRTYIQGGAKAPVQSPRKVMTPVGTINGASVRLFPIAEHIGIGEGLETCIAAYELFEIPTWAVLNTNGIRTFEPPKGVMEITVFSDNDSNYAGQAAAYHAANRLAIGGFRANVMVPELPDTDWLDVLQLKRTQPAEQRELIGV